MIAGLTFLMSSTSRLNRCRASGRKLVRNTSDRPASSYAICWPSGLETSRPIERLPRLACSKLGLGSPVTLYAPTWRRPRWGSPVTACSTLITSSPQAGKDGARRRHEAVHRDLEDADAVQWAGHQATTVASALTRVPASRVVIRPPPWPEPCARGLPRGRRCPQAPPSGHHRCEG